MAPMIKTCNLPLTFFRFNDNDFLKLYLFHVYKMILIKQAQIFFRLQQELMTLLVSNNVTIMIFFLPQSFLSVFSRANKPLNVGDEREREKRERCTLSTCVYNYR